MTGMGCEGDSVPPLELSPSRGKIEQQLAEGGKAYSQSGVLQIHSEKALDLICSHIQERSAHYGAPGHQTSDTKRRVATIGAISTQLQSTRKKYLTSGVVFMSMAGVAGFIVVVVMAYVVAAAIVAGTEHKPQVLSARPPVNMKCDPRCCCRAQGGSDVVSEAEPLKPLCLWPASHRQPHRRPSVVLQPRQYHAPQGPSAMGRPARHPHKARRADGPGAGPQPYAHWPAQPAPEDQGQPQHYWYWEGGKGEGGCRAPYWSQAGLQRCA